MLKQLIPHFIQEKLKNDQELGHFSAFTMFVDISGFTKLTQTLIKQGAEGVELLSQILNKTFNPMVEEVYKHGGFIPHFAGDAFTAIFETVEQPIVLLQIAKNLQNYFNENGQFETRFSTFSVKVKYGISYGRVNWGIVGNNQKSFYFNGPAIDQCADCQSFSKKDEIIYDKYFDWHLLEKPEAAYLPEKGIFILGNLPLDKINPPTYTLPKLEKKILQSFLPKEIINFNDQGEFRNVTSVFISFKGLVSHDHLNEFATFVLDQVKNYRGYFKELDFGDKGGVMVIFFGAPVTFENNNERALSFANSLLEEMSSPNPDFRFRVGITAGISFAGIIGGAERCQYAVGGTHVNLAARLMIYADWMDILVSKELTNSKKFSFIHKGDIKYKGLTDLVPTFESLGSKNFLSSEFTDEFVGRQMELQKIFEFAKTHWLQENKGIAATIYGDAGMGKSRLIYELKNKIKEEVNCNWKVCHADQILKKSFNPFNAFLKVYFDQKVDLKKIENKNAFDKKYSRLLQHIRLAKNEKKWEIIEELERLKPILLRIIGFSIDGDLWSQLDAKGRYNNIISLFTHLFIGISLEKPLVLVLEDANWYDEASLNFIHHFIPKIDHLPIFLMATSRFYDDGSKPDIFDKTLKKIIPYAEISLDSMDDNSILSLAKIKLGAPFDHRLKTLLLRASNGNPFFIEQIIAYFKEGNLLVKQNGILSTKQKDLQITGSINAILMARVDRLSRLVKETVKAAAVIGREFEVPVLQEVMKAHFSNRYKNKEQEELLTSQIKTAEKGNIWYAINELRYIFKHSLLQEAVVNMQLKTRLVRLHHQIAVAIEKLYHNNLEAHFHDLAYHYEKGENSKKAILYLNKAADHSRKLFQNKTALGFYDKLLVFYENKNEIEYLKVLLKKNEILILLGNWEQATRNFKLAQDLALKNKSELFTAICYNNFGKLLVLKSDYQTADKYLNKAATIFEKMDDLQGRILTYGHLGDLYFRQAIYSNAKKYYLKSIGLDQSLQYQKNITPFVSNLGLTYMNEGQYVEGIEVIQRQLTLAIAAEDKNGMVPLYVNLGIIQFEKGDLDDALYSLKNGQKLAIDLGNKLMKTIAIGVIGQVYQMQGNYQAALENFKEDLKLSLELKDKRGIAIAYGLLGNLNVSNGLFEEGEILIQDQLKICRETNYRKGSANALMSLARLFKMKQDLSKAKEYYKKTIVLAREIQFIPLLAEARLKLLYLNYKNILEDDFFNELNEISATIKKFGKRELEFEVEILKARYTNFKGETPKSEAMLADLIEGSNPFEKARIYYDLQVINTGYRKKAVEFIEEAKNIIPHIGFDKMLRSINNN